MAALVCQSCNQTFEHFKRGRRPLMCPKCRSGFTPAAEQIIDLSPKEFTKVVEVVQAPPPPTKALTTAPVRERQEAEKSAWEKRIDAKKAAVRAKIRADKDAAAPPVPLPYDPDTLTSATIVEGKTVAEWAQEIGAMEEDATGILDVTGIPGWAYHAYVRWTAKGKPTPNDKTIAQIRALREKAEERLKFANLDTEAAIKLEEVGNPVAAQKKREQAEKKKREAEQAFAEAEALVTTLGRAA